MKANPIEQEVQHMRRRRWNRLVPYLFISPFLVSFALFFVYPSAYSFILSFFSYKGYGDAKFIGLKNYIALLNYGMFWNALQNTFFYFVVRFMPMMVVSFMLAYLLSFSFSRRTSSFYKPLLFMPQVVIVVAAALCWKVILGGEYGVINRLLGTRIDFLGSVFLTKASVIAMMMWRATGWFLVIYMSGLTTISPDVIEASKIDGASSPQRLFRIIIPLMKPIFLFAFMMDAINSMKIYTEPAVLLGTAGDSVVPISAEPVLNLLVTRINGGGFGLASAIGWVLFFIIALLVIIINVLMKDREVAK